LGQAGSSNQNTVQAEVAKPVSAEVRPSHTISLIQLDIRRR
jgi:hypothetical protein